jgi:hypothetical protein
LFVLSLILFLTSWKRAMVLPIGALAALMSEGILKNMYGTGSYGAV